MGNRILKESICCSEDIDKLTAFEETVFYRLIVNCDDYGRLDARPAFLKSKLFVTKQGITVQNIEDAILKLASIGLIKFYEVDRKSFLLFPKWEFHQQIRAKRSKYPEPNINGNHLISDEIKCSPNTIQLESEYETNLYPNTNTNQETDKVAIKLPLIEGGSYEMMQKKIEELQKLYPKMDVTQELRGMIAYFGTEKGRKNLRTAIEIETFIVNWLNRNASNHNDVNTANNKPRKKGNYPQREQTNDFYANLERQAAQMGG